jgi:hypothetical protein
VEDQGLWDEFKETKEIGGLESTAPVYSDRCFGKNLERRVRDITELFFRHIPGGTQGNHERSKEAFPEYEFRPLLRSIGGCSRSSGEPRLDWRSGNVSDSHFDLNSTRYPNSFSWCSSVRYFPRLCVDCAINVFI